MYNFLKNFSIFTGLILGYFSFVHPMESQLLNNFHDAKTTLETFKTLKETAEKNGDSINISSYEQKYNNLLDNVVQTYYPYASALMDSKLCKKLDIYCKEGSNITFARIPVPNQKGYQCMFNAAHYSTLLLKNKSLGAFIHESSGLASQLSIKNLVLYYKFESKKKIGNGISPYTAKQHFNLEGIFLIDTDLNDLGLNKKTQEKILKDRLQPCIKAWKKDKKPLIAIFVSPNHGIAVRFEFNPINKTYHVFFADSLNWALDKNNRYISQLVKILKIITNDDATF
jgi:hypothetical protein